MPQDTVVATGLADEIAFRLQAAILDGEFPPGTHLQQDELCARFGVSRTPVREALRKLQAQHLVDLVPNKGATVRTPSRHELSEVYVLRAELEGFAAELAAGAMTTADLAALDDAQAAMDKAVAQLEAHAVTPEEEASFNRRITVANEEFHGIIHRVGRQRVPAPVPRRAAELLPQGLCLAGDLLGPQPLRRHRGAPRDPHGAGGA